MSRVLVTNNAGSELDERVYLLLIYPTSNYTYLYPYRYFFFFLLWLYSQIQALAASIKLFDRYFYTL
jgi:hypothetical protein